MTHTIEVTLEEQMSAVIDFLNRTGNGDMADKVRDLARHRTEAHRALVEALEAVKRSLEDAVCCDETMSHDEAYSEILYFGGTALASAYDKVCAALSLTKAQESGV